jgi:hypothetical protein
MKASTALLAALLALPILGAPASQNSSPIDWQPWSNAIFDQAKRENKFVLLDLEAVWCHWCHVMDETTYKSYPSGQPSVGVDEKLTLLSAVKTTPRLRDSPIGGDAVGTLCIRSAGDGFLAQSSYTVVGDFHFGMQALELRLNFRGKWRLVWLQEKIA